MEEYLPRSGMRHGLEEQDVRRAYLQRRVIMATKGLREEMLADLHSALDGNGEQPLLTSAKRHVMTRLGNHPVAVAEFVLNPEALEVTNRLTSPAVAEQVRDAVVRGLYWHARWAFSARNGRALSLVNKALWRVLDRRTLVSAVPEKLHGSGAQ